MQTGCPRGPLELSHFWFCSPVPSPGDRYRSQLQSLPALEELPARGGREMCSLSETLLGAVTWQLPLSPARPRGRDPGAWP